MTYDAWKTRSPDDGNQEAMSSELDELLNHIDTLMQRVESGADWAEICRLEARAKLLMSI